MATAEIFVCYDRNPTKALALVATPDLRHPKHVPIDEAPSELKPASFTVLMQMHTIANSNVAGLSATQKPGFVHAEWEVMGPKYQLDQKMKARK